MKDTQIFIKSDHNHEPGSTTRRVKRINIEPSGQFVIAGVNVKEDTDTEIFEIVQI